jgi:GT2 family glycosyltransferase
VRNGVAIVTFNSRSEITQCLDSLLPQARREGAVVVVYDSGSTDGTVGVIAANYPDVDVLVGANEGFGAGMNRIVFDHSYHDVDSWLLLNPDCLLESPNALRDLRAELDTGVDVGSVSALVLFKDRTAHVSFEFAPEPGSSLSEQRLRIGGVAIETALGPLAKPDERFVFGALGWQTANMFGLTTLEWAVSSEITSLRLWVESMVPGTLRFVDGNSRPVGGAHECASSGHWVDVPFEAIRQIDQINNAGSFVFRGGGGDRMFRAEYDASMFNGTFEAPAWSGCCVLVRSSYFKELGGFSKRYFLYYEDSDMSVRGAKAGYRFLVAPHVIARHSHSASSNGEGSVVRQHCVERSRGAFLARNATPIDVARELLILSKPVVVQTALALKRLPVNRPGGASAGRAAVSQLAVVTKFAKGSVVGARDRVLKR